MLTEVLTWENLLIANAVVVLIVAVLLILVLVTARSIDRTAATIWDAGKQIARNTVSIWMLQQTNIAAAEILATAKSIVAAASSIDQKLDALGRSLGRKGA